MRLHCDSIQKHHDHTEVQFSSFDQPRSVATLRIPLTDQSFVSGSAYEVEFSAVVVKQPGIAALEQAGEPVTPAAEPQLQVPET